MEIFLPVIVVGTIGFSFAVILAIASKKLHSSVDVRVNKIVTILPNVNCGACGFKRCSDFARAVADGRAKPMACIPGGPKVAHGIADILEVTTIPGDPQIAVVHCKGGKREALDRAIYDGIRDCDAAVIAGNGDKICSDGCLGLGTCVRVCHFDAIVINENNVAVVNTEKCTGCGNCVKSCPRGIISLIPQVHKIYLACSNHDLGSRVKKYCSVGCNACTICVKTTRSGAISMDDNLPQLDYTQHENFVTAANKCPSRCFIDLIRVRPKVNIDTKCDGCGECIPVCPVDSAIQGEKGQRHIIIKDKCIGCGLCLNICHAHAISLWGGIGYEQTTKHKRARTTLSRI